MAANASCARPQAVLVQDVAHAAPTQLGGAAHASLPESGGNNTNFEEPAAAASLHCNAENFGNCAIREACITFESCLWAEKPLSTDFTGITGITGPCYRRHVTMFGKEIDMSVHRADHGHGHKADL